MNKNLEKPVKPTPPGVEKFRDKRPVDNSSTYVIAYRKYEKDLAIYLRDLEIYQQTRLIRFVKNANEKLILKKYKIFKNEDVPKPQKGNNKVIWNLKD